ncbi:MAG: 16S rRNA (guanine(966)-N(2))-methyltransferase RsmD [Desulfuromonadia bacterium]
MRVIAGTARGRRLSPPPDRSIRPTADRVKEALFSIITSRRGTWEGGVVLDLCAGTGSLGIEALSRGASRAIFGDTSSAAIRIISTNLSLTGFHERGELFRRDWRDLLTTLSSRGERFDVVFADPPYASGIDAEIPPAVISLHLLNPGGILAIEHDAQRILPTLADHGIVYTLKRYGATALSIYERTDDRREEESRCP